MEVYFSTQLKNQCLIWAMQGLHHLLEANLGSMVKNLGVKGGFQGSRSSFIKLDSKNSNKGMLIKLWNQGMLHGPKMMLMSLGMIMEGAKVILEEQGTIKV
jgi:hypothetical protein